MRHDLTDEQLAALEDKIRIAEEDPETGKPGIETWLYVPLGEAKAMAAEIRRRRKAAGIPGLLRALGGKQ